MTARQLQTRQKDSQELRVLRTDDGTFCVESAKGKIMYLIGFGDDQFSCTCADFVKNFKRDEAFKCKHIIAVENVLEDPNIGLLKLVENHIPKLNERFITTIKGKDFVVYSGLLSMSHEKGIQSLRVQLLQYPTKDNGLEAVCRATLESKDGEVFSELGHASPKNVNRMVVEHILHMAATRSKARVMRDFVNVGLTSLEELTDIDDVIGPGASKKTTRKKAAPKAKPAASKKKSQVPETTSKKDEKVTKSSQKVNSKSKEDKKDKDAPVMSEAQKRAIYNLSRRRGISVEDMENIVIEDYGTTLEKLSSSDASEFIRSLQQAA